MKYNELKLTRQAASRRVGRGISSGQGKTAGRGTKGQGARKSSNVRLGFEGGQIPLYMRLPHLRGFKSHRDPTETVYTYQLEAIKKAEIDNHVLYEAGLVSSPHTEVKLLFRGDLSAKKAVRLQRASESAQTALKKAGGSFIAVNRIARIAKKTDSGK